MLTCIDKRILDPTCHRQAMKHRQCYSTVLAKRKSILGLHSIEPAPDLLAYLIYKECGDFAIATIRSGMTLTVEQKYLHIGVEGVLRSYTRYAEWIHTASNMCILT